MQSLVTSLFCASPDRLPEVISSSAWRLPLALSDDVQLLSAVIATAANGGVDPATVLPGFHPPVRFRPGPWDALAVMAAATSPLIARSSNADTAKDWTGHLDLLVFRILREAGVDEVFPFGGTFLPGLQFRLRMSSAIARRLAPPRVATWRASYWRRSLLATLQHPGLAIHQDAALCLRPEEAQQFHPGWPPGLAAVLTTGEKGARWSACDPGREGDFAAGLTMWPPSTSAVLTARPDAEVEAAALASWISERGVAERAWQRSPAPLRFEDIAW